MTVTLTKQLTSQQKKDKNEHQKAKKAKLKLSLLSSYAASFSPSMEAM